MYVLLCFVCFFFTYTSLIYSTFCFTNLETLRLNAPLSLFVRLSFPFPRPAYILPSCVSIDGGFSLYFLYFYIILAPFSLGLLSFSIH